MGRKKHIELLEEFKKKLSKKIQIERMILFGSRANSRPKRWSDFDIIIVSKNFKGKKSRYRSKGFYDYWDLNYPVDFLCYTPEEFNRLKNKVTMVSGAVKTGIEIK